MHIHILGICGTFMGGLAQLAKALGHRVTGCDANVYPPMSDQLQQAGIELVQGFGPEQLSFKPDVWVIGNVVSRGNPLMEAILDAGQPYVSGPQWIGENILRGRNTLAVAGTHGKTTTSSMLAWVLEELGQEPGFLIGGVPGGFGLSARLGGGKYFVIEADEYDTAFFDKRSKFVHYRPHLAVLNNLEFDHADIFPDLAAIERQFHHLIRTVPGNGHVVVNADASALERVLKMGCWSTVHRFGAGLQSDWTAEGGSASRFKVLHKGVEQGEVNWGLNGRHNVDNALAILASIQALGLDAADACKALSSFPGVKRRMELRAEVAGVRVYDDFAHHPTAIATTLEGARAAMVEQGARGNLHAVFEPRSNTMKQGTLRDQLATSFESADQVWCYAGGVSWDVEGTLSTLSRPHQVMVDLDQLESALLDASKPGDWFVLMSNGAFGGLHSRLIEGLGKKVLA